MAGLEGKRVGQLVISSDYIATSDAVATYVEGVSANLQAAINSIAVDGYVPISSLQAEVLKIISANYDTVADFLDGVVDHQVTIDSGDSKS